MSYETIYQTHVFYQPRGDSDQRKYLVAFEMGSNNLVDEKGRVCRDWTAVMAGNHDDVMEKAVFTSRLLPGGSLRRNRGSSRASDFVKEIRNQLESSRRIDHIGVGHWTPDVRVPYSDHLSSQIDLLGLTHEQVTRHDKPYLKVHVPQEKRMLVFDIGRLCPNAHASNFFAIYGLPSS